jgi:uncharacterized protein YggU (UPF0235/DUF167 family)
MRLSVRVKPGAHRDGIWREGEGLFVRLRSVPKDGEANTYLISYLSGSLRLPPSVVKIVKGHSSLYKVLNIDAPEQDLRPMLSGLPMVPQTTLFDD